MENLVTTRKQNTQFARSEAQIIRPLSLASHARESVGALRLPAITRELVGSAQLWVGMTILEPGGATRPHHHGDRETGIYLVAGRASLHWGEHLESQADLEVGDL